MIRLLPMVPTMITLVSRVFFRVNHRGLWTGDPMNIHA